MEINTAKDLADEFGRRYRAKHFFTRVRIYASEDTKDTAVPGGKRTRWSALAARVFAIAPTWHKLELLDAQKCIVGPPIERDIGQAIGLPEDLADIANAVSEGGAGVNLGQQLAGFGGLLQLVGGIVKELRRGDRELVEAICQPAIKTMQVYAGRVAELEGAVGKMIHEQFALARKAGMLAASERRRDGGGEEPSMADEAMMQLLDKFTTWMGGGGGGPPPGSNGAGGAH